MATSSLLDYVVADVHDLTATENSSIRRKALPIDYPLTNEDIREIQKLVDKFNSENEDIAGLSFPQIGISRCAFVIGVPEKIAKIAKCKVFPKNVWINPAYEKVNDEMEELYERCSSVKDVVGPVKRYTGVYYKADNLKGRQIQGVAYGHLARVIQHEIDHLDGKLFIDHVPENKLITFDEYVKTHTEHELLLNV